MVACALSVGAACDLTAKERADVVENSSTITDYDDGSDAALISQNLNAVREAMRPVFARDGVTIINGSRNLTKATDPDAIGKALLEVSAFTLSTGDRSDASISRGLQRVANSLQESDISNTPVSYPKDTPTADVRAIEPMEKWSGLFLSWRPEGSDLQVLSEVAMTLESAVAEHSALRTFFVESQSWAFQRSGVAVIDVSTQEGLWYSYQTVRALAGRR